jgi:DNA-binding MarR family transcriptional regulator
MQDESSLRPALSLPHALVRLFRLVNRAHSRALKPLGLSAEQAHVLTCLWVEGAMTVGALQRMLALSSPTLTGAIDRMEALGLVRRVPSPDDRRAIVIEADPRAAKKRTQVEATLDTVGAECFAGLPAGERRELLRLLHRATAALES